MFTFGRYARLDETEEKSRGEETRRAGTRQVSKLWIFGICQCLFCCSLGAFESLDLVFWDFVICGVVRLLGFWIVGSLDVCRKTMENL